MSRPPSKRNAEYRSRYGLSAKQLGRLDLTRMDAMTEDARLVLTNMIKARGGKKAVEKYVVQIFGRIPDCMEVEAVDKDAAEDAALQHVIALLDFEADLKEDSTAVCEEKTECPGR